ncbi:unnamed protein product, partial [Ectocarpus sp. 8 AP-2014]
TRYYCTGSVCVWYTARLTSRTGSEKKKKVRIAQNLLAVEPYQIGQMRIALVIRVSSLANSLVPAALSKRKLTAKLNSEKYYNTQERGKQKASILLSAATIRTELWRVLSSCFSA